MSLACRLKAKRCVWYSCSARCGNGHCIECLMPIGNKKVGELCSSLGKSSCAHRASLTHPFPCIKDILWLQRPSLFCWSTRKYTLYCWDYIVRLLYCWRKHKPFFVLTSERLNHTRGSALQDLYTNTTHSLYVTNRSGKQLHGMAPWLWFLVLLKAAQIGWLASPTARKPCCSPAAPLQLGACRGWAWEGAMLSSISTYGHFQKHPDPKLACSPDRSPCTLASVCEFRLRGLGSRWLHSFTSTFT